MKFALVSPAASLETKTDVLMVPMYSEKSEPSSDKSTGKADKKKKPATRSLPAHLKALDQKLDGHLTDLLDNDHLHGKAGETHTITTFKRLSAKTLVVYGLGESAKLNLESLRKVGASLRQGGESLKAKSLTFVLPEKLPKDLSVKDAVQALVEGVALSAYQFTRYLKPKKTTLSEVHFVVADKKAAQAGIERGELLAEGVNLARDLINTPAADMAPLDLAQQAKKAKGVSVKIHDVNEIRKLKMGAFLGVAAGSTAKPPYFIEMHYKPKVKAKTKVAIIGKGVTFDSGGYSIKPAKAMETMKDDMSGAAAVIGLMSIITRLNPKVAVSGYVAATENMVDGLAQRPGDVVTAMNGKTIEVLNTDAEGRLTLADAMTYALQSKPDYVIDMATLTGACLVALGMIYSAIMGTDPKLIQKLITAGQKAGENIWELPLVEEYKEELKSPIADLKNIGGPYGGSINGGLFLEAFSEGAKWAHLDIAGPAWTEKNSSYIPRGGTGVMVRTLAAFLEEL